LAALLLDEHVPRSAGRLLAQRGHEVVFVVDVAAGADDRAVLERARMDGRVLVTLDADFGKLIFQQGVPPPPAIVYVRLRPVDGFAIGTIVADALADDIDAALVVCTRDGRRRRPFPQGDGNDGRT
jgi:predicted nuclease of predicted toxin-antitoxin system